MEQGCHGLHPNENQILRIQLNNEEEKFEQVKLKSNQIL